MNIITKIITWVLANGATALGISQAIVKALKEVLTGVVNFLSLFMSSEKAEKYVSLVRTAMNVVDNLIEKAKEALIK